MKDTFIAPKQQKERNDKILYPMYRPRGHVKEEKSLHSSAQRNIFPCGEGINRCLRQPEGVGMRR
jgi:hypothetical protein